MKINKSDISDFATFEIEKNLIKQGYNIIAGIDEAGRGSLAGPLSVGLVIYNKSFILNPENNYFKIIKDSKKLTPEKRETAKKSIESISTFSKVKFISHKIIDKININNATELALINLLESMNIKPDIVIIDGNFKFNLKVPYMSIVKGDTKSISIASASIIAKVKRDKVLEKIDLIYPEYDMKNNKGYGTKKHRDAISKIGFSPIHRKTYEPVKSMVENGKGLFENENSPYKYNNIIR